MKDLANKNQPDEREAQIPSHLIYAEMELAFSLVPKDRTETIAEARTGQEVCTGMKTLDKTLQDFMECDPKLAIVRGSGNQQTVVLNRHGKFFMHLLRTFPFKLLEGRLLSSRVEVFRQVVENLGGLETFEALPSEFLYPSSVSIDTSFLPKCRASFVHRCVTDIRTVGKSRRFRTQLAQSEERSRFILKKMVSVIQNLFEVSAKLLVVRVDFEYLIEARPGMTSQVAKKDLRNFLNKFRHQSVFNDFLGYIWKIEQGIFGGFHFHFIFFFNGDTTQRDIFYSVALGKYWNKVTEGRGTFHSCNANKAAYRYLGIGKISHADMSMQSALLVILKYLASSEKAQSIPNERSYGFSKPIEVKPKSLGGRPRSASASTIFTRLKNDDDLEVSGG